MDRLSARVQTASVAWGRKVGSPSRRSYHARAESKSRTRSPANRCRELAGAGALTVLAPRPAAGPALTLLQLLLGPPDATLSGGLLLRILDPADELVAGQGRDVVPGIERRGVVDQGPPQVRGQLMHNSAGHRLAAHGAMVVVGPPATRST